MLIDLGCDLKDRELVVEGITAAENRLPGLPEAHKSVLLYNLGNGYSGLADLDKSNGVAFDPDTTPLKKAKKCFESALSGQVNHLEIAESRINYGNCLSSLGRSVEAIYEYEAALKIDADHPMAWGNLGVQLEYFISISRDLSLLMPALTALEKAIGNDRIIQHNAAARVAFEERRNKILAFTAARKPHHAHDKKKNIGLKHLARYVTFCVSNDLFLNFVLGGWSKHDPVGDFLGLSLITEVKDEITYPKLARTINDIKEHFALARLLVYESAYPPLATLVYDDLTAYTDNLDYGVQGISAAKLKTALEVGLDTLDKVAFFLNDYLKLGIADGGVTFRSIWKDSNGKIRPEFRATDNFHLFGLYNLATDGSLAVGKEVRKLRNLITHRYLIPHAERVGWGSHIDGPEYHIDYHDLYRKTIAVLRFVKSAVIYLVAFIDLEEHKKQKGRLVFEYRVPRQRSDKLGPL